MERPDGSVEISRNGHKYRVEQTWGELFGVPMGSLYYLVDNEVTMAATISRPFEIDELSDKLELYIEAYPKFVKMLEDDEEDEE